MSHVQAWTPASCKPARTIARLAGNPTGFLSVGECVAALAFETFAESPTVDPPREFRDRQRPTASHSQSDPW